MNPFLKSKINFHYLLSMVALLLIHNYNFKPDVITPSTIITDGFSIPNFIEILFSNSLLRFRMGLLMAISGYLMANSVYSSYVELFTKKVKSLVLPYFLVSIIGLMITFLFEMLILGTNNHENIGLLGKSIWHLSAHDFYYFLVVAPVPFQLWYLKTIFLLALVSPIVRIVLTKFPIAALGTFFFIWMFTNYIDGETKDRAFIFYFIGFYLNIKKIDVLQPFKNFKPSTALALFVVIGFVRASLEFVVLPSMRHQKYILTVLFKTNELLGVYGVWFCFDSVVVKVTDLNWYKKLGTCSFFIYAFHAPLMTFTSVYCAYKGFYTLPNAHLILYIGLPLMTFTTLVLLDKLVKSHFTRFYLLLTGGRGVAGFTTTPATFKFKMPQFNFGFHHSMQQLAHA